MRIKNKFSIFSRPLFGANDVINLDSYAPINRNICFADGDPAPAADPTPAPAADPAPASVTMTPTELNKAIADGIAAHNKASDNESPNAFDKIEQERKARTTETQVLEETKKSIAFDMGFDAFIDKNSRSFTVDKSRFRESVKGLSGDEVQRTLSVTAAKDFFSNDENLSLLNEQDKDYIKNSVIGLADNAIDYKRAFSLIESALHVKNRIGEHSKFKQNSNDSNINNGDTPNVTAYLKRCADAGKPSAA